MSPRSGSFNSMPGSGPRLRGIGELHRVLADHFAGHEAEARSRAAEERLAATEHEGTEVELILIDETELGEACREFGSGDFDLALMVGLQLPDEGLEIAIHQRRIGSHCLEAARDNPFRLRPPSRREVEPDL